MIELTNTKTGEKIDTSSMNIAVTVYIVMAKVNDWDDYDVYNYYLDPDEAKDCLESIKEDSEKVGIEELKLEYLSST